VAIAYPPGRAPIIISAYYDAGEYTDQIEDRHQAVLAEVGRIAADWALS
jgi:beta-lactamase class A